VTVGEGAELQEEFLGDFACGLAWCCACVGAWKVGDTVRGEG
jgi:hypothetical protein